MYAVCVCTLMYLCIQVTVCMYIDCVGTEFDSNAGKIKASMLL